MAPPATTDPRAEAPILEAVRRYVEQRYGPGTFVRSVVLRLETTDRLGVEVALDPSHWRPLAPPGPQATAQHGPDFRAVNWYGRAFSFTEPQAEVIKLLWQAMEEGVWDVGDRTLLQAASSQAARLVDVFKDCEAWGEMLVEGGTRGTHRLAPLPG